MTHNLPVKTLTHGDLTIEGFSRAAVQTYWRIPELKIGFDLGAQPWSFMGTPTWFVSHAHIDHLVALPVYVGRRRMMRMEPPTISLHGGAFTGRPGEKTRDRRLSGVEVTHEIRIPRVAYLGDSSPPGLDACQAM